MRQILLRETLPAEKERYEQDKKKYKHATWTFTKGRQNGANVLLFVRGKQLLIPKLNKLYMLLSRCLIAFEQAMFA